MNRQSINGIFNSFIKKFSGIVTLTNFWIITLFAVFSLPFNLVLVAEIVDVGHKSQRQIIADSKQDMLVSNTQEHKEGIDKKTGIE